MRRSLVGALLVAAGCRQMLDLEPARLEPDPASAGSEVAGTGGDVPSAGGRGGDVAAGAVNEPHDGGGLRDHRRIGILHEQRAGDDERQELGALQGMRLSDSVAAAV